MDWVWGATAQTDPESLALYLFLLTAADCRGLSFYSDKSLSQCLRLDPLRVEGARRRLLDADLIAYQKPDHQALSLPQDHPPSERVGQAASVGDILRRDVARLRPRTRQAFLRLQFAPGQAAQVDWGSAGFLQVGNTRARLSFFVMVPRNDTRLRRG